MKRRRRIDYPDGSWRVVTEDVTFLRWLRRLFGGAR